jgi:hypothetical protein
MHGRYRRHSSNMKNTATLSLSLLFAIAGGSAAFADTAQTTVVTTTTTAPTAVIAVARDGFTESYSQVMITRNGITKAIQANMKLNNGIVVRPDGTIIVPGKMNRTLHSGDWLAFDGTLTRGDSGRVEHLQPDL